MTDLRRIAAIRMVKRLGCVVLMIFTACIWLAYEQRRIDEWTYKAFLQHQYVPDYLQAYGHLPEDLSRVPGYAVSRGIRVDQASVLRTHRMAKPVLHYVGTQSAQASCQVCFQWLFGGCDDVVTPVRWTPAQKAQVSISPIPPVLRFLEPVSFEYENGTHESVYLELGLEKYCKESDSFFKGWCWQHVSDWYDRHGLMDDTSVPAHSTKKVVWRPTQEGPDGPLIVGQLYRITASGGEIPNTEAPVAYSNPFRFAER